MRVTSAFGATLILVVIVCPLVAQTLPAGVPSLDEMAGDWLKMADVANPPDVNNFHDMLIVNRDLTSFFCNPDDWLWGPKGDKTWKEGYPLVTLTVAGKEYPTAETRWYPYRALRRNTNCGGFQVETDTRMINERRAVLVKITVQNEGSGQAKAEFTLSIPGELHNGGPAVLNTKQRNGYVTAVRPATKPDSVSTANGSVHWHYTLSLAKGATGELGFVAADGNSADASRVATDVDRWSANFNKEFDGFKQVWDQRWADTFTPGNKHFSGHMPVLTTDNSQLRRNYYMGVLTMLELERTQFPVHPRSFITSGERSPGTQYYWDASMTSTIWALLEPQGMKATLRRWLVQNPRSGSNTYLTDTTGFDKQSHTRIDGYAFNAQTIFKTALVYLSVNGDLAFLGDKLQDGKTVLERMNDMATDWKTLVHSDSPLADYGDNSNLLECAPAYIGRVASLNAQNVWMMRQLADIYEHQGDSGRGKQLREMATKFLPSVLSLYKSGDGVWYGMHADGKQVELRHCVDYIYVGDAIGADLSADTRRQMTEFVKRELLMPDWMRAMSLKDAAAAQSDRPDHGPMGAYDGWPAMTVATMWRLGYSKEAFEFYCQTANVTREGPFAQAREFWGPHRDQRDAPVRIAERAGCMKECVSGAAFADVVVSALFGLAPTLDGKTLVADAHTSRPFSGKLANVSARGKQWTLTAGAVTCVLRASRRCPLAVRTAVRSANGWVPTLSR